MPRCRAPGRLAALATAVVAVVLAAAPALAATGQRGDPGRRAAPQVSVEITSVSPEFARPKDTVTVSGMVINPTGTAQTGLSVQLWSSGSPLLGRTSMDSYLSSADFTGVDTPEGNPGPVFSLAPHSTLQWTLTLRPSQAGMRQFGVYPLAVQLSGPLGSVARARTFLPYWPGNSETRALKPLRIGWVWPLIDTPQQAACSAMRSGQLAASLAPGGRLSNLLTVGSTETAEQAKLTWAIDPALLNDVSLMTHPYRVGVTPMCTGGTKKPADITAGGWLSGVRTIASQQNFFVTPYADVDVAALAHRGLNGNLASAFSAGQLAAARVLSHSGTASASGSDLPAHVQRTTPSLTGQIAWPPAGAADYGVLEALAGNDVRTVILDSNVMPPSPQLPYTPGAATSTTAAPTRLHVLLADHTIARILAEPRTAIPGAMPAPSAANRSPAVAAAASFAQQQWFLAETAMIATEAPGTARSVVIMPPRRWAPTEKTASTLLSETVQAPWLRPATLASMVAHTPRGAAAPNRKQPPPHRVSRGELRAPLLKQVSTLTANVHLLSSILVTAGHSYLSNAIAAIESSAWRGDRANQRRAQQQLRRVASYVRSQLQQVTIVHSLHVTLGGKSGPVPVSISNHLDRDIQVRLVVKAETAGRLEIAKYPGEFKPVIVHPGAQRLIKIPVRSAAAGSNTLILQLATPDGRLLGGTPATLTVEATHFGTLAIVIIVVALVVFVSTATGRAIRRGAEPPPGEDEDEDEDDGEPRDPAGLAGGEPSGDVANEPAEPGKDGLTLRVGPDPASGGAGADSVGAGADVLDRAKEADDHASTPGRGHRL